jgi:hypothetical protein
MIKTKGDNGYRRREFFTKKEGGVRERRGQESSGKVEGGELPFGESRRKWRVARRELEGFGGFQKAE